MAAGDTASVSTVLDPGGAVTGRVTDAAGNPLAGARVRVSNSATEDYRTTSPFWDFFADAEESPAATERTGADGSYRITGVTPGQQTVCVTAAGPTGGSSSAGYLGTCLGGATRDSSTPVSVTAGQTTSGIDVALPAAGGVAGRARAADGSKVNGIFVVVFRADNGHLLTGRKVEGAAFRFTRLAVTPVVVCVEAAGHPRAACTGGVTWNGRTMPAEAKPVQLTAGTVASGVRITLPS